MRDNVNFTTIIFAMFLYPDYSHRVYESRSILARRWSLSNGKAFLDISYPGRIHGCRDPIKFLFSLPSRWHPLNHSFSISTDWILISENWSHSNHQWKCVLVNWKKGPQTMMQSNTLPRVLNDMEIRSCINLKREDGLLALQFRSITFSLIFLPEQTSRVLLYKVEKFGFDLTPRYLKGWNWHWR